MTTRRDFLTSMAVVAALPTWRETPELILVNGDLLTQDLMMPRAQALAVAGGRILAVGTNAEIRLLAGPGTRTVDLGGQVVIPGVIDAHNHPSYAGIRHLREVDCDLRSIGAIQAVLRERAATTQAGEWVLGFKYDDTKTAEGRFLTSADLDAVSTSHPIYVEHRGGHTAYVNSMAYHRAGITESTPDPVGGRIERDGNAALSARAAEAAPDIQ
ncbi:MAG: amidohydrolase family protein, partial [Gemmatimonadota bacterium]